jgi:hypothetical protein
MPNYKTLKKKTLQEKLFVFKGHVSLVAFMASIYMVGVEYNTFTQPSYRKQ